MIHLIPENDQEEQALLTAHAAGELIEVLDQSAYVIESPGLGERVYGGTTSNPHA